MSVNVTLLRDSFEAIKPVAHVVVDYFYQHLFTSHPEAKPLFAKVEMNNQKGHLIKSLVYIVDHVDKTEDLIPYLKQMGARHVKYGTAPEHYNWVGYSLISTFKHFFKHQWTPELESTWIGAYEVITQFMLEGANELSTNKPQKNEPPPAPTQKPTESAHEYTKEALLQALETELKGDFSKLIETVVRDLLAEEIQKQTARLVKSFNQAA